jgi:hypothetical protein
VTTAHSRRPAEAEVPFVDGGPRSGEPDALVLDIGGDIGALVLFTTTEALGAEIEVSRWGDPHRTHTLIRRRRAAGADVCAGVYPSLVAGEYVIWGLDGTPVATVHIVGGQVTEYDGGSVAGRV